MTLHWLLFHPPLRWAHHAAELPVWEGDPYTYLRGFIRQSGTGEPHVDLPERPPETPLYFPRLVGDLEPGVIYGFMPPPTRPYEILARLTPHVLGTALTNYEEPSDIERKIDIPLRSLFDAATTYGLLRHPEYRDSAYAWTITSFTCQILQALWRVTQLECDKDDPLAYQQTLSRIWDVIYRINFRIEGQEHSHPLWHAVDLKPLRDMDYTEAPSRRQLRREALAWLQRRLRTINERGNSEFYLDFDSSEQAATLVEEQTGHPLARGQTFTYLAVKAGLYHCALYHFLEDFNRGGALRSCQGCGRLFLPTRRNNRYCPSTSARCRKWRQRAAERRFG